jgi:drug/metabolite transporter (DMT)-like permease
MSDRLSLSQIALLTFYAIGMSGGQVLFKMAAMRYGATDGSAGERLFGLLYNVYFLAALVLYAAFSILWVWILSFTPLSRAYPFVALAFAVTPLLGGMFFNEAISLRLLAGIVLILGGLFLVAG